MPIVVAHVSMLVLVRRRGELLWMRRCPGWPSSMASRAGPAGIVSLALQARRIARRVLRLIGVVRSRGERMGMLLRVLLLRVLLLRVLLLRVLLGMLLRMLLRVLLRVLLLRVLLRVRLRMMLRRVLLRVVVVMLLVVIWHRRIGLLLMMSSVSVGMPLWMRRLLVMGRRRGSSRVRLVRRPCGVWLVCRRRRRRMPRGVVRRRQRVPVGVGRNRTR